jgi:hypothetical protein
MQVHATRVFGCSSLAAFLLMLAGRAGAAQTQVCVDVQLKSWKSLGQEPPATVSAPAPAPVPAPVSAPASTPAVSADPAVAQAPPPAPVLPPEPATLPPAAKADKTDKAERAAKADPFAVQPERYLKRMVEYEVTHLEGFEAVSRGCSQTVTVEMYPLPDGWTVFARYTGTAREEKVDRVQADELGALAQRLTDALVNDKSISETINRQNVLRADSEARMRMVDGRGYFTFGMGTMLRVASLPTAGASNEPVSEEWRLLTPLELQLGFRGKYQAWGLEVFMRGMLGLNERATRRNDLGGHADYSKGMQLGLHFLRYLTPDGMNSTYVGGGANFELSSYKLIKPAANRYGEDRESLLTGGLNADLLFGYEFMRASAVHFYSQIDVQLPTYAIDTENDAGGIETYAPGAVLQIGIVF